MIWGDASTCQQYNLWEAWHTIPFWQATPQEQCFLNIWGIHLTSAGIPSEAYAGCIGVIWVIRPTLCKAKRSHQLWFDCYEPCPLLVASYIYMAPEAKQSVFFCIVILDPCKPRKIKLFSLTIPCFLGCSKLKYRVIWVTKMRDSLEDNLFAMRTPWFPRVLNSKTYPLQSSLQPRCHPRSWSHPCERSGVGHPLSECHTGDVYSNFVDHLRSISSYLGHHEFRVDISSDPRSFGSRIEFPPSLKPWWPPAHRGLRMDSHKMWPPCTLPLLIVKGTAKHGTKNKNFVENQPPAMSLAHIVESLWQVGKPSLRVLSLGSKFSHKTPSDPRPQACQRYLESWSKRMGVKNADLKMASQLLNWIC